MTKNGLVPIMDTAQSRFKALFRHLGVKLRSVEPRRQDFIPPPPIDVLPEELFSHIFLLFASGLRQSWFGQGSRQATITLLLVCRKWRAIALTTRQLWTIVDLSCPALVPLLLERSGEALIDITFSASISPSLTTSEVQQTCRTALQSSSRRISSLRLVDFPGVNADVISTTLGLLSDPKLSWPHLNGLELRLVYAHKSAYDAFQLHLPLPLTRIRLDNVPLPLASPAFGPRLRHLHLGYMAIPVQTLLLVLSRCNQLKVLSFSNLRMLGSEDDRQRLREAPLNCIDHVQTECLLPENTHLFLEHPNISKEAFIAVTVQDTDSLLPFGQTALARLHQNVVLIFEKHGFGGATIEGYRTFDGRQKYFPVQRNNHKDADSILVLTRVYSISVALLLSTLGSPNCRMLGISFPRTQAPIIASDQWQSVFIYFPNLEHFYIKDSSPWITFVAPIQALSSSHNGQGFQNLLPRLQLITLELCGYEEILGNMWDEVIASLRRLCKRNRKLTELRVIAWNPPFDELDKQFEERGKKLANMLGPHVGKVVVTSKYNDRRVLKSS